MKVKYFSDDNHEFDTKRQCEKYEHALNDIKNMKGIPVKEIGSKRWYKISGVAEFYFFDHMDDAKGSKSNKSMYEITKIVSKISHYLPYWITKDFKEGIMIDKKRVEVIDQSVEFLNEKIESLKEEKKDLENLRGMEIDDDDYRLLVNSSNSDEVMDEHVSTKNETPKLDTNYVDEYGGTTPEQKLEPHVGSDNNVVKPMGVEHTQEILEQKGIELEAIDIVEIAMEDSGVDVEKWNTMDTSKINNIIEEQINILI